MKLKLGLPKGSLEEATINMFKRAGFNIVVGDRSYLPTVDDKELEITLYRAQELPRYVESGTLDAGLTGRDWILENNSRVVEVADFRYAKQTLAPVKWVLAVPIGSRIRSAKDLQGKTIATELVNVTKKYLKKHKVRAKVEFSWGATEVKPPQLADAIVEVTETGASLKANRLKAIDTVIESSVKLIVNRDSWKDPWKREKLENVVLLLKGSTLAEEKVGIKMNVSEKDLARIIRMIPALKKPTISRLSQKGWVAVESVIDEKVVRTLIPRLKKAGAGGIIEYPLNKVIY